MQFLGRILLLFSGTMRCSSRSGPSKICAVTLSGILLGLWSSRTQICSQPCSSKLVRAIRNCFRSSLRWRQKTLEKNVYVMWYDSCPPRIRRRSSEWSMRAKLGVKELVRRAVSVDLELLLEMLLPLEMPSTSLVWYKFLPKTRKLSRGWVKNYGCCTAHASRVVDMCMRDATSSAYITWSVHFSVPEQCIIQHNKGSNGRIRYVCQHRALCMWKSDYWCWVGVVMWNGIGQWHVHLFSTLKVYAFLFQLKALGFPEHLVVQVTTIFIWMSGLNKQLIMETHFLFRPTLPVKRTRTLRPISSFLKTLTTKDPPTNVKIKNINWWRLQQL